MDISGGHENQDPALPTVFGVGGEALYDPQGPMGASDPTELQQRRTNGPLISLHIKNTYTLTRSLMREQDNS